MNTWTCMTDTEINIAIAESLGCKDCHAVGGLPCGIHPNECEHSALKKYTASLDACAELEAKLAHDAKRSEYIWYLNRIHPTSDIFSPDEYGRGYMNELQLEVFGIATCNPSLRCEAYLRTIGKWKEGE